MHIGEVADLAGEGADLAIDVEVHQRWTGGDRVSERWFGTRRGEEGTDKVKALATWQVEFNPIVG